jgi:ubiquinone/menaquinone biosynthesis C-methylase UbiE
MRAPFDAVSSRLRELYAQALDETNRNHYDQELWHYYGHLKTQKGSATRTRFVYDLCALAAFDPTDKVVLDAGCGFGALAFILRFMGAREVQGVDITESRLTTFQKMIRDFGVEGVHAHLLPVDATPFPDRYFDMVLSNEAISHYIDLDGFLREAARLLKPGGVLLIADGNNGANPKVVQLNYRLWERFENGPPGSVDGHHVYHPYVETRAEIIRQACPELSPEEVRELARRTSYFLKDQIIQAVERYRATGEMPNSTFQLNRCPVEPTTGETMENHYHPIELARHIESFGFRARAYAYFGGAGGNPLVRLVNWFGQRLTPLTVRWARAYRIVAWRQDESSG